MTTAEFDPTIPKGKRPQTYALEQLLLHRYSFVVVLQFYICSTPFFRTNSQKKKGGILECVQYTQTSGLHHCKGKLSFFFYNIEVISCQCGHPKW